jgi:hypothetical protein
MQRRCPAPLLQTSAGKRLLENETSARSETPVPGTSVSGDGPRR